MKILNPNAIKQYFKYVYHLSCLPPKLENHISTTKLQPGITRCIEACASSFIAKFIENKEDKIIEVKVISKSHDHYLIISVVFLFHKVWMTYSHL